MIFKEFCEWCNDRAYDGCWSMGNAIACCDIFHEVIVQPFWNRERYWKDRYEKDVVEQIVNPINKKIEEMEIGYGTGKPMRSLSSLIRKKQRKR